MLIKLSKTMFFFFYLFTSIFVENHFLIPYFYEINDRNIELIEICPNTARLQYY